MTRSLALAACLALGLAVAPGGVTLAKTYTFKNAPAPLPITLPDSWKVGSIKNGIEIRRPDDEILMWVQAATAGSIGPLMDEYKSYFTKQGVSFTAEPKTQEHDLGQTKVLDMDLPATWKGKPTVVRIAVITKPDSSLLVGYWASPQADKESDPEVNKILQGLVGP